jgi:AcrR family transcriptional regulator
VGTSIGARALLIDTGLKLAAKHGLTNLERNQVCKAAKVSNGNVHHFFGGFKGLLDAIVETAIARDALPVIGMAIACRHPLAAKLSEESKRRAVAALVG